jgi:cytoskeletal protein RodZ
MKTVGEILAEARKKKNLEIEQIAEATKIRPCFLKIIEENNFNELPSATVGQGFIKNYAQFLGLSPKFALAVFRRDFIEDKQGKIIPRGLVEPLDKPRFLRSSRIGFFILTAVLILSLLIYLMSQYLSLRRGPSLKISSPQDQLHTEAAFVEVVGETEPDATVTVNGRLVNLSSEGEFSFALDLNEGKNLVIVEAVNKLNKTRREVREVFRD